jgi:hypothetical protein
MALETAIAKGEAVPTFHSSGWPRLSGAFGRDANNNRHGIEKDESDANDEYPCWL